MTMTMALVAGGFLVQMSLIGATIVVLAEARAHARDLERLIEVVEEVVCEDDDADAEREEVRA